MTRRYPWAPLAALVGSGLAGKLNVSGSTLQDYQTRGVTPRVADRLAMKAGLHPSLVWPSWFDDVLEDHGRDCAECGGRFLPKRHDAKFCDPACNRRWWGREGKRRYRQTPKGAEYNRSLRRAYYAENAEYEKGRERRRYHERSAVAS